MKLFITGTSGFIGKSLKEYYTALGHEVRGYYRGDSLVYRLESFQPDVIINCAGEIYKPDLMYSSNVELTRSMCEWVKQHPTIKLIHLGSSSEYGIMSRASCEQDAIKPVDMYQATKGMGTLMCQGYARQHNLKIAVARVYSAFGANERPHRLFPTLYRAFFKDEPMKLYNGFHDFIYIDDFIKGIDMLVNNEFAPGEIVNFGSGVQTSNLEVLQAWEAVTGKTAPVEYIPELSKKFESTVWLCDPTYAREKYNFTTEHTLISGITKMIEILHDTDTNSEE